MTDADRHTPRRKLRFVEFTEAGSVTRVVLLNQDCFEHLPLLPGSIVHLQTKISVARQSGEEPAREDFKRIGAALELRPQHGALPANPEKCSQLVAIGLNRQIPGGLRLNETTRKARLPVGEDRLQLRPIAFGECAHFLTKIADQAATPEFVSRHRTLRIGHESVQARQRRQRSVIEGTIDLARKMTRVLLDQLGTKSLLALKVMIERAFWHADAAQDFVDARSRETFLGEHFQTRAKQQVASPGHVFARLGRSAALTGNRAIKFHAHNIRPIVLLNPTATSAVLRKTIEELGLTDIQLGQVLTTRRGLRPGASIVRTPHDATQKTFSQPPARTSGRSTAVLKRPGHAVFPYR